MKALLIAVNFTTGDRPECILTPEGKIKENLWCANRWQNLDDGKEIRIIKDKDTAPYENQEGVTVLRNEGEIRSALEEHIPIRVEYSVSNEGIMNASIKSSRIDFEDLPQTASREEELAFLYDKGVRGLNRSEIKPQDPKELK